MILSLDTSEIVAGLRSRSPGERTAFDTARERAIPLVVSAVAVHELVSGALGSARPAFQMDLLASYLGDIQQEDFTPDDATASGRLRAALKRQGAPIGDIDTLIAGQALARGWAVVTRNIRHFGRVEGLVLIDWSVSADPLSAAQIAERVAQDPG